MFRTFILFCILACVVCIWHKMRINVILPESNTIVLEVASSNTISEIKAMTGLETSAHWLICQGINLCVTRTLEDYNISDNFTLTLQNIKEARKARKAAKKLLTGSSPVTSSDDEAPPPPPGLSIPVSKRQKPAFAKWRNYQDELKAKEEQRFVGLLTGDSLEEDVDTLQAMGINMSSAMMLAVEMKLAMSGVCDDCGHKGGSCWCWGVCDLCGKGRSCKCSD